MQTNLGPLLNPFYLIPTGIVVILDMISLPFYLVWASSGQTKKSIILLILKPFSTLVCIYFLFTQFGGGFFLGAVYALFSQVVAIVMFVVYLIMIIKRREGLGYPKFRYFVHLILGLLIVISLVIPTFAYIPIKDSCSLANSEKTQIITQAMKDYYEDNNKYPEELDELVPLYLSSLPVPACNLLTGISQSFEVCLYADSDPIFFVHTIDGVGFDFYDFENGNIDRIHSFLDVSDPCDCQYVSFE